MVAVVAIIGGCTVVTPLCVWVSLGNPSSKERPKEFWVSMQSSWMLMLKVK